MAWDINKRFEGLPHMETPYEFLVYYDDEILSGDFNVYKWQKDKLRAFGRDIKKDGAPKEQLIRECLVANNGSGKSQMILAPCAAWLATQFPEALCCVTSSSHKQMSDQTERYIARICKRVNERNKRKYPKGFWHITRGSIRSQHNGSFIDLFVTDEAGKFEGRHPIEKGRRFGFFFDECKSISDDLFNAAYRCNGMSHRLDQSSPGDMVGHFYRIATDDSPESLWNVDTVTIYDCPHISRAEADAFIRANGLDDPVVRSSLFAEFTSAGSNVVIPREVMNANNNLWLDEAYVKTTKKFFGEKRAGLDLAAGGDENVLSVWHGNVQIGLETFRMKDTTRTADELLSLIKNYPGLDAENIYADDGGVGRGIIDQLARRGCKVNRVLNQSKPRDKTRYFNRGTELWFDFKRFIEEGYVKFLKDDKQLNQLCARYFHRKDNDKLILESKREARAKGHPSPDRADACVLAWKGLRYPLDWQLPKKEVDPQGLQASELIDHFRSRRRSVGEDIKGFKGYRQHAYLRN